MPRVPRLTGGEMVKCLQLLGLTVVRIRGSHYFMDGPMGRTSVPVHGQQPMKIGTLRAVMRDVRLSTDQLADLYNRI